MKDVEKTYLMEILGVVSREHGVTFDEKSIVVIQETVQYYTETIYFPFVVGQFIQKRNKGIFGTGNEAVPVIKIEHFMKQPNKSNNYHVNKIYVLNPFDVVAISKEEAESIMDIWNDSSKIHPPIKMNEFSHIREDTGNVKVSLEPYRVQKTLFEMRMKYPDGNLQAYVCPECGEIHIGKAVKLELV